MRWYEAILVVAIAMWAYERLRRRRSPGRTPDTVTESDESFSRNVLGACEQAVESYPDNAGAHIGLARTLHELGRHDEALEALGRAAELDPNSYADYWNGLVNLRMGNNGEALEFFDRSIANHPDDADMHCLRGRALAGLADGLDPKESRGRYEGAAGAFEQALRLDPHHAGASEALDGVRERLAAAGEPCQDAELALAGSGSRQAPPARKG